jgi:ABC-type multidrug transport system permease subunit
MDEITIPYHLAIPTIICLIGLLTILLNRKKLFLKNRMLWISITTFLILYLFIVGTSTYEAIYYQWDLNRYNLDKDGLFGGVERTDEQKEAMNKLKSDTGRNFSFITGFIFAFIISTFIYIIGIIILRLKKHNERKKTTHNIGFAKVGHKY